MCRERSYSISSQQFPINLSSSRHALLSRGREIPAAGKRLRLDFPLRGGDLGSPNRKFAPAYAQPMGIIFSFARRKFRNRKPCTETIGV